MAKYRYKARDNQGNPLLAAIEAENEMAVEASLRSMGYSIISIEEETPPVINLSDVFEKIRKTHQYELIYFSRQLSAMLKAGIPLSTSLSSIGEQSRNKLMKETINAILGDIQAGISFSDALAKYPVIFSDIFVSMVRVGEVAGILDQVLERVAELNARDLDVKTRIRSATVYPVILVIVALIILSFLLINIVPKFVGIFESYEMQLPLATRILLSVSFIARKFFWIIILAAGIFIFWFRMYIRTVKGRYKIDS
ncbi:MAG: type II secretion system F family protein, partial [Candidatus Omnitrophica bacterium]|nr:type II secretion system F family protein [Candidatus Omnitrophota bacterium]